MTRLLLTLHDADGPLQVGVPVDTLILAGGTGRDPALVPEFTRTAAARLTTAPRIEAPGGTGSETEFVLLHARGRLWVGAGSEQPCDKPVAPEFWSLSDVAGHWDRLVLRAWADGALHQEASVAALRAPQDLLGLLGGLAEGATMFSGALGAPGGVRMARRFAFALEDPVLGRTIRHEYDVEAPPAAG